MNKKTIITVLLVLVTIAGQAQVPLESVKELTMKSEYFNHERQVLIYTPGGYQQFDQTYYDVIYVFDAQCREIGTSTIFATTTTCPCPCMATLGCSRRATTTANRQT